MKRKLEIELGFTFWLGISFAAGCFGFGWIPFWCAVGLSLLKTHHENKS